MSNNSFIFDNQWQQLLGQGLARLPHGPIANWGQDDDEDGYLAYSAAKRREKVIAMETLVMQDSGYRTETDL